jgi:ribosomal protein S18 acetylase RimI-like enzyme
MDHQPRIRRAQVADARSIALVHVASSADSYRPLAREWKALDEEEQARKWGGSLTAARDDRTRVDRVGEVDGEVVGFVTAGPARRDDLEMDLEVYVIHVLPTHRGRGIGGRLWSAACGEVRGTDLRSLYLATYAELRCCSFYEARGGERVESKHGVYQGGEVTRVVYRWARGQSSEAGPYSLRTASQHDFEFLHALKRSAYEEHVVATYGAWDDPWQRDRFAAQFDPPAVQVVIADGRAVGELVVQWHEDPVFLAAIEIEPELRGRGIGTAIIRDVVDRAGRQGKTVRLQVFKVNERAIRLYEKLGFRECGVTDTHRLLVCEPGG